MGSYTTLYGSVASLDWYYSDKAADSTLCLVMINSLLYADHNCEYIVVVRSKAKHGIQNTGLR